MHVTCPTNLILPELMIVIILDQENNCTIFSSIMVLPHEWLNQLQNCGAVVQDLAVD
jgi:hypothetical protein